MTTAVRAAGATALTVAAVGASALGAYAWRNRTFIPRLHAAVTRAGFVERQATVDGRLVNYAEGPANGPALLLIHGQGGDWRNYAPVLPALTDHFRVIAVDCFGHGGSARAPETYTAVASAQAMLAFQQQVLGEPALVSGHSSGGLIAARMAATAPAHVQAVFLEDPPFYATELPRAKETWNWVDLATNAHTFLVSGADDWTWHSVEHMKMWDFFGDAKARILKDARTHHDKHPREPISWWYMPPLLTESLRALPAYDPQFGEAFYTGSWNDGVDLDADLRRISVPATYVHTRVRYGDDGIMQAAASHEEAARAAAAIPGVVLHEADSGHGFHWEKPADYVQLVLELLARTGP